MEIDLSLPPKLIPVFTGQFGTSNERNAVKILANRPPGSIARARPLVLQEDQK